MLHRKTCSEKLCDYMWQCLKSCLREQENRWLFTVHQGSVICFIIFRWQSGDGGRERGPWGGNWKQWR